ncbi:MAG: hypothetical protein DMG72_14275 [Acidobacteria bacterium]|nr:MAG: hypothetical protein DMG72_14275 [Acidobacteriota bacterium]
MWLDIELVGAPGAGHIVRLRDLLAIEPNVGAVVDSLKIEPEGLALVVGRQDKFLAVPPRDIAMFEKFAPIA